MTYSSSRPTGRQARRRAETIDEALVYAIEIMTEEGVGGLSVSAIARRMGIQPPSLYKYFPSLHAVYDELFGRAARQQLAASRAAMAPFGSGTEERLAAGVSSVVRWSVENPALAQLLFWRPVPGFEPSEDAFTSSVESMEMTRAEFAEAIRRGRLDPGTDLDEIVSMCTVVISGLISQQLSNEPGVSFESGRFSSLTDRAVENLLAAYRPRSTP